MPADFGPENITLTGVAVWIGDGIGDTDGEAFADTEPEDTPAAEPGGGALSEPERLRAASVAGFMFNEDWCMAAARAISAA